MASSGAEAPSDDDRAGTLMTVLRPAMITILAAGTATLQARQLLIAQTAKPMGEAAVMSATAGLATAFSLGSFLEFLISPTYGKISDRFGRKPLFLSFLIGPALVRTLCVLITNPYLRIRTLWIDFALARVIGVQPTMAAAGTMISDAVPVAAQPAARAQLNAAQALGQIIGNYASGWWNTRVDRDYTRGVLWSAWHLPFGDAPKQKKAVAPAAAKAASTGETVATKSKSGAFSTLLSDPECGFLALTIAGYEFIQWPPISTVSIIFMKER
eukprot:CAMPEP_0180418144 /NCGR_PEP_ID=MMETSP1036_2-20121128/1410_1 /TAXON_ID=632150 /ORGANISM="Azadinium spinosum, Strain 3D9" /LENGTH=270 /DNA_ID=CAMNT_0022423221 /DNA_START=90 /DNA_END=900 /DNA_ORIENTATION=-